MMLSISETIRTLRESRGWKPSKLAYLAGLSREYIKSIESGANKKPGADKLIKIAKALDVPYQNLFKAAGYIKETRANYNAKETPQQIIDRIKIELRQLEKLLSQDSNNER